MDTHDIKGEDHYQCREVKAERDRLRTRIAELEAQLAEAQEELDDMANHYLKLRQSITPRQLVENGLRDGGDLAPSESIEARIDWMVDDAMREGSE